MSELESETVPKSSGTPEERRQSESTTQATPQLNGERNITLPEPEPVPSTSGINSKGKKLADPKSRLYRKKRENWEDSIISAFKFIKISGELNEDDSSDDDYEDQKERDVRQKAISFDYKEDESAILELSIDPRDTYPQVHDAEDDPGPSTSFIAPLETGTPGIEPQPVGEGNFIEEDSPALAPASPPPHPLRVSPLSGSVMSSMPFYNLRLPKETIRNLRDALGITITTILQEKAIPILMRERDAFMHASSGSGKTVAFTIPIVQHLLLIKPQVSREDGIRILVVVPNKESAMKTYQIFTTVARPAPWIVIGQFGGGDHFRTEKEIIRRGVTVLITTPARFLDHLRRTSDLFLKNVSCLVVDGLDQIFEQGDEKHLTDIITVLEKGLDYLHHPDYISTYKKEHVEASRQTILVSALVTQKVACFTGLNTTNPMMIDDRYNSPPRPISMSIVNSKEAKKYLEPLPTLDKQYFMIVPERMKLVALVGFVMWRCRVVNERRILVFAGTQTMADYFSDLFNFAYGKTDLECEEENATQFVGMDVYKLSPFMSKNDKINLFMTFSRSKCGILFCSDGAVKGIDLPRVDWVIHLHAPTCSLDYMTRIGMASSGMQIGPSLALLLPAEKAYVQELRNLDIPLTSMRVRQPFRHLWAFYPPSHSIDDMTFEIQTNMEDIVNGSKCMHDRACLAFASWCRLYSSYPENLKHIFRFSYVHMDNYVHSFGLREQSTYVISQARKLHSDVRGKVAKKRRAPAEAPGSPREPSAKLSSPTSAPPDEAQMPMQAAAPTQTPIGTEQNDTTGIHAEALGNPFANDRAERKKRRNDVEMEQPDDEEAHPEKRSK